MTNNNKDVTGLVKLMVATVPIVTIVCTLLWNTYAQPKVDTSIDVKIAPIEKKVDTLFSMVTQLQKADKQFQYQLHQLLYFAKKQAGKKAVQEMEEETLIFKPTDY